MTRLRHVYFDQLISHRFRGFSEFENTLAGFKAALDFGVKITEFDIRVTADGVPIIYHDEQALDGKGKRRQISQSFWADFADIGGAFARMPSADALFTMAAAHPNKAQLLIDIKDYGFETQINALTHFHRLQDRAVYVSWLPNVLYALHDINPDMPLCLSHWPKSPGAMTRAVHKVHTAKSGKVPRLPGGYIHGERSGWYIKGGLKGRLRDILKACSGSVCVPQNMLIKDEIKAYQADGITVSAFSYTREKALEQSAGEYGLDLFFSDNKTLFELYKP